MFTLLVNRETRNVIGLISPCHRPSQNPAMCGADTCATLFGPAAQETRTSTTATRAPASTSLGGGHGEGARRHRVVVLGGRFLWSPGVSGPVYVLVLVESGGCRGQVWAADLTAARPGNWGACRPGAPDRSEDGHAICGGRLANGLEEGCATARAVAAAAGGQAERLGAVVERATGVAALSAHVGLDQATHDATRVTDVTDRDVERGHGSSVGTGGRPLARHRLADEGVRDGEPDRVAEREVVVADQRVVIAREAVSDGRADERGVAGVGVPGVGQASAVPRGEEVVGAAADHVEAERATVPAAVDGVAAGQQRGEDAGRALDPEGTAVAAGSLPDRRDLGAGDGAVANSDNPVRCGVYVPGDARDARPLHRVAHSGELAGAVLLRRCRGTGRQAERPDGDRSDTNSEQPTESAAWRGVLDPHGVSSSGVDRTMGGVPSSLPGDASPGQVMSCS